MLLVSSNPPALVRGPNVASIAESPGAAKYSPLAKDVSVSAW